MTDSHKFRDAVEYLRKHEECLKSNEGYIKGYIKALDDEHHLRIDFDDSLTGIIKQAYWELDEELTDFEEHGDRYDDVERTLASSVESAIVLIENFVDDLARAVSEGYY